MSYQNAIFRNPVRRHRFAIAYFLYISLCYLSVYQQPLHVPDGTEFNRLRDRQRYNPWQQSVGFLRDKLASVASQENSEEMTIHPSLKQA
jgi:hypothetical protein